MLNISKIIDIEMLRCRAVVAGPVPRLTPRSLQIQPPLTPAKPQVLQQCQYLSQKPERSKEFPAKYDRRIEAGW